MATSNSLHHLTSTTRRHSIDALFPPHPLRSSLFLKPIKSHLPSSLFLRPIKSYLPSSLFLKPIKSHLSSTTFPCFTFSTSISAATSSAVDAPTTFDVLQRHLEAQNFREADDETRRLLIHLAGEPAQKRKYVFFSEVQFISKQHLQAIDSLWRKHSNNRYGYSVQRKIWKKVDKDFTKFFIKLGWMKKLETSEVEQFNYKAFPNEFFWELTEDTPQGHLPLTNALRGTQLFTCILNHPAFEEIEEQEKKEGGGGYNGNVVSTTEKDGAKNPLSNRGFKADYSF